MKYTVEHRVYGYGSQVWVFNIDGSLFQLAFSEEAAGNIISGLEELGYSDYEEEGQS